MGRLVRDFRLETREARSRLKIRHEPYWRLLNESVHLGYRKGDRGGIWHVRIFYNGKYVKRSIGAADDFAEANGNSISNYSQAQEQARKIAEKVLHGNTINENKPYTLKDAIEEYLLDFKSSGKKSIYTTETQIKAHILPELGNKLISALTFKELNIWKNKLATTHKRARTGLGNKQQFISDEKNDPEYQRKRRATANRIITIIKAILNHAFKTDRVKSDEAWKKLKPFKNVSEPNIRFLSEEEAQRLLNASDSDFRLLVRAALLTGARYGELGELKVCDYNSENKTIFIRQSKSGKPRHIPLNDEGVKFFDQLTMGKNPQAFIFTRSNSTPWKKNYQIRPLVEACSNANITPAINFHILRHTYASSLAMRGVPLQVISTVLGHSDTRITHKHYAHLMPSYVAEVIREHLPNFGETEKNNVQKIKTPAKMSI